MEPIEFRQILQKQDTRANLESQKRNNLLAFDITNNRLIYSPTGTNYFDFYNSLEIDNRFTALSTQYLPQTGIDASKLVSGLIDPARIPVLSSQIQIITSTLADLTPAQQAQIGNNTLVVTSDGFRWAYSGTGDKTLTASYIQLADITPDWTTISNRPTLVSYWTNDAGYLTAASPLDPSKISQSASYRLTTDAEKAIWNAKQNVITLGTTSQYLKGDLSLGTFPTALSSFSNDVGYLTSASSLAWGKLTGIPSTFTPSTHSHAWADITSGKPTTLAGYGITDAVSSSDSRLSDTRIPTNNSYYVFGNTANATNNISGTIWNQTKSGFYCSVAFTDSPTANAWTHVIKQVHNGGGWSFDIAANYGGSTGNAEGYFVRVNSDSNQGTWRTLYHSGNLTKVSQLSNDSGYLTSASSLAWGNITSKPFQFLNYSTPTWEGFWPSGVTQGDNNFSILWGKSGADCYLNAGNASNSGKIYLQISNGSARSNIVTVSGSGIVVSGGITCNALSLTTTYSSQILVTDSSNKVTSRSLAASDIPNLDWSKITTGIPSTFAPSAHSHAWTDIASGKPTTLAGYGITDAASSSHTHTFASLTSKPTTLAGYIGTADAGMWNGSTSFAHFSNAAMVASNALNYGLLQDSNGYTYLNAASGKDIKFRIFNVDKMVMSSTMFAISNKVSLTPGTNNSYYIETGTSTTVTAPSQIGEIRVISNQSGASTSLYIVASGCTFTGRQDSGSRFNLVTSLSIRPNDPIVMIGITATIWHVISYSGIITTS